MTQKTPTLVEQLKQLVEAEYQNALARSQGQIHSKIDLLRVKARALDKVKAQLNTPDEEQK